MRSLPLQCLLLTWIPLVYCNPVARLIPRAPQCVFNEILSIIKSPPLSKSASSFCSSYIQTSTTATVTNVATATSTTTTTLPDDLVTVYQTTVITDTTTEVVTSVAVAPTVTATVTTVTETITPAPVNQKRFNLHVPPWISAFAASEISSACTCLITSAPISTSIVTTSATTTTVDTISAQTTDLVTFVTTEDILNTVIATTIEPPTTTVTIPTTATAVTTIPAPICSVGHQAVQNPSFESVSANKPVDWILFASYEGFEPVAFDAQYIAYQGSYAIDVNSDPVGPDYENISQQLEGICPGATYQFSVYVGIYTGGVAPAIYSTFSATLDGVTVIAAQSPCPPGLCNLNPENNQAVEYRQITGTVVPTSADPLLVLTVAYNVPQGVQASDTLVDLVTLTLQTLP